MTETPAAGEPPLRLSIIERDAMRTIPLTGAGSLTIGRSSEADVDLADALISRTHARLYFGSELAIEDLGSANGTRTGGAALAPHTRVALNVGQTVELGTTLLVVQRAHPSSRRRRLWSHSYFEVRLAEECLRAARAVRTAFALLRIHVEGGRDLRVLEQVLTAELSSEQVIGLYAPGEYEVLLPDTAPSRAESIETRVAQALERRGFSVSTAIACFPEDGRTADVLIGAAADVLDLGPGAPEEEGRAVILDPAMLELYRIVDRVAQGTIAVLLLGETGAGKEVVAEELHRRSPRARGPFVRINCAALADSLFESELFGHEKGAFTGANEARAGLLEAAASGTAFLDEVGELSASAQAKLLRAIERREIVRLGSVTPRPIDVRFVSATNRDLEKEVDAGRFRRDLYFRLNAVALELPPLRARPVELAALSENFAASAARALGLPRAPVITAEAKVLLSSYDWPGNIRELKNVIERAVLLAPGEVIDVEHLPAEKMRTSWSEGRPWVRRAREDLSELSESERGKRARILAVLEECGGNRTRAAMLLGVSRQSLAKWIKRLRIPGRGSEQL